MEDGSLSPASDDGSVSRELSSRSDTPEHEEQNNVLMKDGFLNPASVDGSVLGETSSHSDTIEHEEQNNVLMKDNPDSSEICKSVAASDEVRSDDHELPARKLEKNKKDNLCISGFTSDHSSNGDDKESTEKKLKEENKDNSCICGFTCDQSSSNDACETAVEKEGNHVTIEADSPDKNEKYDDGVTSLSFSETADSTNTPFREISDIRTPFTVLSVSGRLDNVSLREQNGAQDSCGFEAEMSRNIQCKPSIDSVRCSSYLESNDTRHTDISELSERFRHSKPDETVTQDSTNLRKYHSVEEISGAKRQLQADVKRITFPNLSGVDVRTSYSLDFLNDDNTNTNPQRVDEKRRWQSQDVDEVPALVLPEEQSITHRELEESVTEPEQLSGSESRLEVEAGSESRSGSGSQSGSESQSGSDSESGSESEEETEEKETSPERPVVLRRQTSFQRELADAIVRLAPLDELEFLLRCGAKVSEPVTQGLTPLHYAVWQRYPAAAELLIREGCDLNARDDIGYTPLHLCAEHGYIDMMNVLLQHNAHVNFNHPEDEDQYPIDAVDEPLRLALKHDQIEAARILLENGANPNGRYFFGSEINLVSPLKTELLQLLLSWGARPDTRDRYGFTPIMKACHVQQEAEEELEERGSISGTDVLRHFAQTLKGIESVLVLISHGADINLRTDVRHECRSVLHYAILSGSSPIVSLLLKQGAKVNFEAEYNKASPLHLAVLKGDSNIINMLLDAGAVMNITTPTVGSPLHVACSEQIPNRMQVLQLLLERGADPNIVVRNESGRPLKPPLGEYLANSIDHDVEVVKIMLRYGAQVVMQTPQQCPLGMLNCLYTVAKNNEVMIELLEAAERFDVPLIRKTPLLVTSSYRELFLDVAANPPSLRHLARVFVRQVMKNRRPEAVEDLALPKLLRQYLLYEIN